MFEEIKKILDSEYHITGISRETNFRKELGLSSFDFLNLICIFEEKYGVELDEEKYIHIVNVRLLKKKKTKSSFFPFA